MIPKSTKMKGKKILKYLQICQWRVIGIMNKLMCTIHDEVNKSDVDSSPYFHKGEDLCMICAHYPFVIFKKTYLKLNKRTIYPDVRSVNFIFFVEKEST